MGVPKFYRWLSERYPCLSEVVHENQIPEFDNLYFDMNGIIHACSHPNDDDPHFRISEEQIFKDIFHYIEVLFRLIRPRKTFFMAVDGVAPRAKMNQQRGRRFRSAKIASALEKKARDKGEELPTEARFDSNCITPGTSFMVKLHEQLKYFVNWKITTDEMWQGIDIYLSGHETPGEGEHKIMDFIRYERAQKTYDPNTRHCLYGLDADLIMLGMVSHEPHFSLLREEVKFVRPQKAKQAKTANPELTTFHLLHLSLLREYLDFEFSCLKTSLPFAYDIERIIDDWVLMGFLVGNDFIPHLPYLHIQQDALPSLYKIYCDTLPDLDGYINEDGNLSLPRFEIFMSAVAQIDRDKFGEDYADLKWFAGKKSSSSKPGRRSYRKAQDILRELEVFNEFDVLSDELDDVVNRELEEPVGECSYSQQHKNESNKQQDQAQAIEADEDSGNATDAVESMIEPALSACAMPVDDDEADNCVDDVSWTPIMEQEFVQHKRNYYREKMAYSCITKHELHEQAVHYVTAIQWNLHYYYHGICSWSWYYPHHYAPFLTDIRGFANQKLQFDLGTPFLPFQQLLAVLPSASRSLLPVAYQDLMISELSPLIDYYPVEFKEDLNGKTQEWEAVVLIPFIDEKRLISEMEPCSAKLTADEKARNTHSGHLLYQTLPESNGVYSSTLSGVFPDIQHNKAKCSEIPLAYFRIPVSQLKHGLLSGVKLDVYFPGFPTFKHLPLKATLRFADVCVFQQNSKKDSFVITVLERERLQGLSLRELASKLLGREVFVRWPHLTLATIEGLSNEKERHFCETTNTGVLRTKVVEQKTKEAEKWHQDVSATKTHLATRRAVEVGEVAVLVHARPLLGKKYICDPKTSKVALEKQWAQTVAHYPLQFVVDDAITEESVAMEKFKSVADLFPIGCEVFILAPCRFYGLCARITKNHDSNRIFVEITSPSEPQLDGIFAQMERIELCYFPGWQLAAMLHVSSHFVGRITGTVYMNNNKKQALPELEANGEGESSPRQERKKNNGGVGGRKDKDENNVNIGLNLKFNKKNEEVPDYSKKVDGQWLYSNHVLRILTEYLEKFPDLVRYMHEVSSSDDIFSAEEVFGPEAADAKLEDLKKWTKALPCANLRHQAAGTDMIDEQVVRALEVQVDKLRARNTKPMIFSNKGFKPAELYRPCLNEGNALPDPKADFQLFDRVVNVREGFVVPVGLRGFVTAIHPGQQEGEMQLDVAFDEEFLGGLQLRGTKKNSYRLPAAALINLTYWKRKSQEEAQNEAAFDSPRLRLAIPGLRAAGGKFGDAGPPDLQHKPKKLKSAEAVNVRPPPAVVLKRSRSEQQPEYGFYANAIAGFSARKPTTPSAIPEYGAYENLIRPQPANPQPRARVLEEDVKLKLQAFLGIGPNAKPSSQAKVSANNGATANSKAQPVLDFTGSQLQRPTLQMQCYEKSDFEHFLSIVDQHKASSKPAVTHKTKVFTPSKTKSKSVASGLQTAKSTPPQQPQQTSPKKTKISVQELFAASSPVNGDHNETQAMHASVLDKKDKMANDLRNMLKIGQPKETACDVFHAQHGLAASATEPVNHLGLHISDGAVLSTGPAISPIQPSYPNAAPPFNVINGRPVLPDMLRFRPPTFPGFPVPPPPFPDQFYGGFPPRFAPFPPNGPSFFRPPAAFQAADVCAMPRMQMTHPAVNHHVFVPSQVIKRQRNAAINHGIQHNQINTPSNQAEDTTGTGEAPALKQPNRPAQSADMAESAGHAVNVNALAKDFSTQCGIDAVAEKQPKQPLSAKAAPGVNLLLNSCSSAGIAVSKNPAKKKSGRLAINFNTTM